MILIQTTATLLNLIKKNINNNDLNKLNPAVHSQEKSANTLLNKLTKSQAYTVSVNQSETLTSTYSSTISPVQRAQQSLQPEQLTTHLVSLKKDLTQLIEKQADPELTIEQIKPVHKKMHALVANASITNEPQNSRAKNSFSSLEPLNLNSQAKPINDGKIKTAAVEVQSKNQLNAAVLSSVNSKTIADDITNKASASSSAPNNQAQQHALTPVARFIKEDLKPLVTQLNQVIKHTQDKANIDTSMLHNGIEMANKKRS